MTKNTTKKTKAAPEPTAPLSQEEQSFLGKPTNGQDELLRRFVSEQSPEERQLATDLMNYVSREGNRAFLSGMQFTLSYLALVQAGVLNAVNAAEASARTDAIVRRLDEIVGALSLKEHGIPTGYTITEGEEAQLQEIAGRLVKQSLREPSGPVVLVLGHAVLHEDHETLESFQARKAALDKGRVAA